jgi:SAM-dependent methyltransferase
MVDWGAGSYETTSAVELAPVADVIVTEAAIAANERVIDVASGSGNAALAAARRGARVMAIDGAPRLLAVAAERARAEGVDLDLREGDLLALPADEATADVVVSVFGVIYATDPSGALREIRRVLRPGGRVFVSAWVPDGPINAMLGAVGRIVARISDSRPVPRFAWNDPAALGPIAAEAGLVLETTTAHELTIRAVSAEAYVDINQDHPMAVAVLPVVRGADAESELRAAQLSVLRDANEDPHAFLVHTPYVIHRLRSAPVDGARRRRP